MLKPKNEFSVWWRRHLFWLSLCFIRLTWIASLASVTCLSMVWFFARASNRFSILPYKWLLGCQKHSQSASPQTTPPRLKPALPNIWGWSSQLAVLSKWTDNVAYVRRKLNTWTLLLFEEDNARPVQKLWPCETLNIRKQGKNLSAIVLIWKKFEDTVVPVSGYCFITLADTAMVDSARFVSYSSQDILL